MGSTNVLLRLFSVALCTATKENHVSDTDCSVRLTENVLSRVPQNSSLKTSKLCVQHTLTPCSVIASFCAFGTCYCQYGLP